MAYVIFKAAGKQYKASEGDIVDVDNLNLEAGNEATFSDVLFHSAKASTNGSELSNAEVVVEVLANHKAKKVIAFKYRRRKGYHRTVGHRRRLTRLRIKSITVK